MQKGMQILHPFLVVHLAAHVSNTNIRKFRRIRFRRHCIRHRITEEESASSSRFRRHCIRIRCCFRSRGYSCTGRDLHCCDQKEA